MRHALTGPGRLMLVRLGLGALAAAYTITAGWALVAPGSFFLGFPGLGMHWVSALPPYNEHLLTDFGGALLGIASALWLAALVGQRRVIQVVLVATLVQAVPHFAFHLRHFGVLPPVQAAASQVALTAPILLALVLLWLVRRARPVPAAERETSVGERASMGGRC